MTKKGANNNLDFESGFAIRTKINNKKLDKSLVD